MANDLQYVADVLVDEAAIILRQNSIAARLVSRDLETAAAQKNKRVDVPVFPALSSNSVTPGAAGGTPQDITPTVIPVTLDQWYEVPFVLSDKEMAEVSESRVVPRAAERAVEALVDGIDSYIVTAMYQAGYNFRVKSATAAVVDVTMLSKYLNDEKVPKDRRRSLLLNTVVTEEFERMASFHEADKIGDDGSALREGSLGRKFGFQIHMDQGLPQHTIGTADGAYVSDTPATTSPAGATTIHVDTGTGTFTKGDIITIGTEGDHVVTAAYTPGGEGDISIYPGLRVAVADDTAVDHATGFVTAYQNLAFHEMAYAFATRPLATLPTPGSIVSQTTDPISGLSLRLELTREHKQDRWSFDVLYGGAVIYPEMIARLIHA